MGKVAFVFSGQGAQAPGMGKPLYDASPAARKIFEAVDTMRPGTSGQCFSGTEEELKETRNTQPCMFAVELAAAAALEEAGIHADMAAGFSLGEISALTYTGAADLETGFRLVCRRGELMQEAAELQSTAMAAVVKLSNEQAEEICASIPGMYPVNYNCPGQVAVSGLAESMPELTAKVKAAGGRALPLKVKGAFHSPYMEPAARGFAEALAEADLKAPGKPLYSNCTGEPYAEGVSMKELLSRQIMSPVRWEQIVRHMIGEGVDTFIECGPGRTLCGLINKTDKTVRTYSVQKPEDIQKILQEAEPC